MKKISCVGYHATGSGAVDDYLREFDNIESANYGIESRFLQDPDGISDLEHNLIENPHRLNSGFALKRFLLFARDEKRTYGHIFGKEWMKWAKSYVNELADFSYKGYWHADIRIVNMAALFIYKVRKFINKISPKKLKKNKYYSYFSKISTYSVNISEKDFIQKTQDKCEELCKMLNKENKEYVVLDQAVSPQNPNRYLRYIKDLKVIIVDRDPRDVYMNDIIKNKDFVLPKNVEQFCKVYVASRKRVNEKDSESVLRINFEDMIYDYENTANKIKKFLNLKDVNHTEPYKHFDPKESIKNTQIWKKNYNQFQEEIKIIEKELKDYLYEFPMEN